MIAFLFKQIFLNKNILFKNNGTITFSYSKRFF